MKIDHRNMLQKVCNLDPALRSILSSGRDREKLRADLHNFLNARVAECHSPDSRLHPLELVIVDRCIDVLRNILSRRNERMAGFSTLGHLQKIVSGEVPEESSRAFLLEMLHLWRGVFGKSRVYEKAEKPDRALKGRKAALARSAVLDEEASMIGREISRYKSGLDPEIIEKRRRLKKRIMDRLGASDSDWKNYRWQLRNVFRDADSISSVITLSAAERRAVELAQSRCVPFGITPYYLGLFDRTGGEGFDRAIRAQVILPPDEVDALADGRAGGGHSLDFMHEADTSPADLVTRRYPQIAIFKPVNTCPQICSYCQRNWEVDPPMAAAAFYPQKKLAGALDWFDRHVHMTEILVTGGDPLLLADGKLEYILRRIAQMPHIQRIRIGTRMPVTLPFRITDSLMDMVARYHVPGRREVAFVTHFEHVAEITPQSVEALAAIRRRGMGIYNQTVFTYFNSRRFENVALRKMLRLAGVDPYYTFNTKGKEETRTYRVPIARLMQEVKEEARLVPGLDRTDEPVFNIPALGKNYLKAAQHHDVIAIHPDGSRIIEFHPWEKMMRMVDTYVFKDISIYGYLKKLEADGEDLGRYRTIWYYI
jgi:lysine 2,3-aminomutase